MYNVSNLHVQCIQLHVHVSNLHTCTCIPSQLPPPPPPPIPGLRWWLNSTYYALLNYCQITPRLHQFDKYWMATKLSATACTMYPTYMYNVSNLHVQCIQPTCTMYPTYMYNVHVSNLHTCTCIPSQLPPPPLLPFQVSDGDWIVPITLCWITAKSLPDYINFDTLHT